MVSDDEKSMFQNRPLSTRDKNDRTNEGTNEHGDRRRGKGEEGTSERGKRAPSAVAERKKDGS